MSPPLPPGGLPAPFNTQRIQNRQRCRHNPEARRRNRLPSHKLGWLRPTYSTPACTHPSLGPNRTSAQCSLDRICTIPLAFFQPAQRSTGPLVPPTPRHLPSGCLQHPTPLAQPSRAWHKRPSGRHGGAGEAPSGRVVRSAVLLHYLRDPFAVARDVGEDGRAVRIRAVRDVRE